MTFKEFREDLAFRSYGRWYVVTTEDEAVHVLQWEPSNYKWYTPKPTWGREEFGYLDEVGANSKIYNIRPLIGQPSERDDFRKPV
jgi:hypothetical protein